MSSIFQRLLPTNPIMARGVARIRSAVLSRPEYRLSVPYGELETLTDCMALASSKPMTPVNVGIVGPGSFDVFFDERPVRLFPQIQQMGMVLGENRRTKIDIWDPSIDVSALTSLSPIYPLPPEDPHLCPEHQKSLTHFASIFAEKVRVSVLPMSADLTFLKNRDAAGILSANLMARVELAPEDKPIQNVTLEPQKYDALFATNVLKYVALDLTSTSPQQYRAKKMSVVYQILAALKTGAALRTDRESLGYFLDPESTFLADLRRSISALSEAEDSELFTKFKNWLASVKLEARLSYLDIAQSGARNMVKITRI